MTPHLQRALLLLRQSRHDLDEPELRLALADDPDQALPHALLALCLARRERFDEATAEARRAVGLDPVLPYAHYALASVLHDRHRLGDAAVAAEEAIRLDPEDADYHGLLAGIRLEGRRWREALDAAEAGLRLDPEHPGCTNVRALALGKLGRTAEASHTLEAALARDPEDAVTHANQGWALLQRGEPARAMEHFREALRLDPDQEWARQGIVEALKARHAVYRLFLWYFLWMARLSHTAQWAIVLGGYFGYRYLNQLARKNPGWEPYLQPVLWVYVAFVLMTWLADPLFNLLLRLNRFGRLALSREQVVASNWVGASLLTALAGLAWYLAADATPGLLAALVFGGLALPLAGTFKCDAGWPRTLMALYTAALGLLGVGCLALLVVAEYQDDLALARAGLGGLRAYALGVFVSGWVANGLGMVTPRR